MQVAPDTFPSQLMIAHSAAALLLPLLLLLLQLHGMSDDTPACMTTCPVAVCRLMISNQYLVGIDERPSE